MHLAVDSYECPAAVVPTCTLGAVESMSKTGAQGMKYNPLAPESTMDVSLDSNLQARWLFSLCAHFFAVLVSVCADGVDCVWGVGWNCTLGCGWG